MGIKTLLVQINLRDRSDVSVTNLDLADYLNVTDDERLILSEGSDSVIYKGRDYKKVNDQTQMARNIPTRLLYYMEIKG